MGPLCAEAVGKQNLLDAGQTRQMHSSTKDSSGPCRPHQNNQDVGWVGDCVEVRDSGMNRA